VDALHNPVALGVVGSRHDVFHSHLLAKSGPHRTSKLRASVRGNLSRHAKPGDPSIDQRRRAAVGGGTGKWHSLYPLRAPVHYGEDVSFPILGRGERSNQVHVQV
jgi:hypothetical protein